MEVELVKLFYIYLIKKKKKKVNISHRLSLNSFPEYGTFYHF